MVRKRSPIDVADSANDAAEVRVVLACASDPFSVHLDVDLAPTMVVPERHATIGTGSLMLLLMCTTSLGRI